MQSRIGNFARLKVPFQNTNIGQKDLLYNDLSLWNNLPVSNKKTTVLNTFKHGKTGKRNILTIKLETRIDRIIIGIYLYL